jgi:hypothetical protein
MKKIAYPSAPPGEEPDSIQTPKPPESEALSSTETGGRGYSLTEMIDEFDNSSDPDEDPNAKNILNKSSELKTIEMLISLGDVLDKEGSETFANFSDFLIEKFAQASTLEPTKLFNQIILKIKRADIPDSSEVIKKLTKIYSRTILLENIKHKDLKKAKESAYKKVLHRANQYLSES